MKIPTLLTQGSGRAFGAVLPMVAAAALVTLLGAVLLGKAESFNASGAAGIAALAVLGAAGASSLAMGALSSAGMRQPARQATNLLDTYCTGLPEGLLLVRSDGTIAFANTAFWRLLRQGSENQSTFAPAHMLRWLPASQDAVYRLATAAKEGKPWEEVVDQPANSAGPPNSRWLRISVHPGPLQGLNSGYVAWRIADATPERSLQNDTISRLRQNLEGIDQIPAGLFAAGPDERLCYVNRTMADWLGTDASAVTSAGWTLTQVLGTESRTIPPTDSNVRTQPGAVIMDTKLEIPGKASKPVRLIGQTRAGGQGIVAGLLVDRAPIDTLASNDGAAEARFTRLFQAAPIAIATIDGRGRVGSANAAFWQLFGIAQAVRGSGEPDLLDCLHEDSRHALREALKAAGESRQLAQPLDVLFGRDKRRAGQIFLGPNPAADNGRESVILFALDTTERKDLEAQFAQSQKMQAVGQLAGGIAHDINNVLTVIIGFSDLLLANSAGDPAFHDLNEIKANANRAANLVRQLLAYSRRQTLRPEVLSLNEVISDLTVFLKRSLGEKVKLERDYGRDLWLVRADQTELGRVFVNLAVNAVDAMPHGGSLTIRTANMPQEQVAKLGLTGLVPGDYILCQVSDSGYGMTADVLERIFEPFFTTKDVGKGTGLGLSTVYGIVKQTGGYIYCESRPGEGTTFRIFLPRHIPGTAGAGIATKTDRQEKPRDLTGSGTVMLVEDEESVRRFAARALRRQGYQILEASNGLEALEIKASHKGTIDLVVSDIVMPEMDGPTLLKELRKTNPDLKIIFMSGYADDALSTLNSSEEFAFLSKPFQLADLVSVVKETLLA